MVNGTLGGIDIDGGKGELALCQKDHAGSTRKGIVEAILIGDDVLTARTSAGLAACMGLDNGMTQGRTLDGMNPFVGLATGVDAKQAIKSRCDPIVTCAELSGTWGGHTGKPTRANKGDRAQGKPERKHPQGVTLGLALFSSMNWLAVALSLSKLLYSST